MRIGSSITIIVKLIDSKTAQTVAAVTEYVLGDRNSV